MYWILFAVVTLILWFLSSVFYLVVDLSFETFDSRFVPIVVAFPSVLGAALFVIMGKARDDAKDERDRARGFLKHSTYSEVMLILKRKALEVEEAFAAEEEARHTSANADDPDPQGEELEKRKMRSGEIKFEFCAMQQAARDMNIPVSGKIGECAAWNGEPLVSRIKEHVASSPGATVDITA